MECAYREIIRKGCQGIQIIGPSGFKIGQLKWYCRVTEKASGTFLQFKNMGADTSSAYGVSEIMEIKGCEIYILLNMLFLKHYVCLKLVGTKSIFPFSFLGHMQ